MEQYSAYVEQLTPSHTHMEGRAGLEVTYQRKVEGILGDDNCFKIVFVSHDIFSYQSEDCFLIGSI